MNEDYNNPIFYKTIINTFGMTRIIHLNKWINKSECNVEDFHYTFDDCLFSLRHMQPVRGLSYKRWKKEGICWKGNQWNRLRTLRCSSKNSFKALSIDMSLILSRTSSLVLAVLRRLVSGWFVPHFKVLYSHNRKCSAISALYFFSRESWLVPNW